MQERPEKGYCKFGQVLGLSRGFLVATEFLVLCRDRGSLCHDMVLRLQTVVGSQYNIFMSRQCLFLCRDNVVT